MVWNPDKKRPEQMLASATSIETVVPSDVVAGNLARTSLGIYVGGAGDVSAVMLDGSVGVFKAVPAGTMLPIQANRINAAGTTATFMVSVS